MNGCNSGGNHQYATGTACGVNATNPCSNVTPLSLGFGLKQNGTDVVVDLCSMMGCVQERNPIGEAYMLACDDAGIFKVSFTRLKTLMAVGSVTPPVQPVYRMIAGDASIIFQKDGVTVDSIPLCNLVSGCNTNGGGGGDSYTLTQQGSVVKLMNGTTVAGTADICAAGCSGTSPVYTVSVAGTNVVLNKDGSPVSQASICPAVTACGGGGGSTNTAPTAGNATYSTLVNTAKVTPNLVTLCSDAEGNTLTITNVSTPAHGTAVNNAGVVTYTPSTGYVGADTFTYTVSDGALTATGTITINVASSGGGGGGGSNLI